ncbi:MAG: ATP-binding protein [Nitrospina sp.]|jgi:DNA replication protein DnaC|nr:ATP-binding protein [Nitrospina sp.]MBT6601319.1 ATP-binding protein [Nitrospina sp.]
MSSTKKQIKVCPKCGDKKYNLFNHEGKLRAKLCSCFICYECDGEGRTFHQDDKGMAFLADCSFCFSFRKRLRLLNDSGIPGKFSNATLEIYQPIGLQNKKALSRAKDFLDDFRISPKQSCRGLLFMGGPGLGKTHLVVSILKQLILEEEVHGKFVDFFQLLSDIRHGYSHDQSEMSLIEPYLNSSVLVIDELAKGRNNEWEQTILDQFISSRYNAADKITLFTTNYSDRCSTSNDKNGRITSLQKQSLEEKVGDRILSRLAQMCDFIKMEGEDYRTKIKPPPRIIHQKN